MQHYPERAKVIKEENRNFLDKVRPWIELATFFTAMGVLIVMVCNSFQTKESINLTRISVNKLDTAFALTREQNRLINGQLDVMRDDYNLSRSSFEVEKNRSVAVVKDLLEKGKPKVTIYSSKVVVSDSGSTAFIDFTSDGSADAEHVEVLVISKRDRVPKDSLIYPSAYSEINKNHPITVGYFIPYRGDFLIRAKVKYKWSSYDLVYEAEKFYRYIFDNKSSEYVIRIMDDNQVKERW